MTLSSLLTSTDTLFQQPRIRRSPFSRLLLADLSIREEPQDHLALPLCPRSRNGSFRCDEHLPGALYGQSLLAQLHGSPERTPGLLNHLPRPARAGLAFRPSMLRPAVTANAAIVPAGDNGDVSVFVTNDTELIIDINGYFAPPASGGLSLYNLAPCRVYDLRTQIGAQPVIDSMGVNVSSSGCNAPANAQSYLFNTTVIPTDSLSFLTLWPHGTGEQPNASALNAPDGNGHIEYGDRAYYGWFDQRICFAVHSIDPRHLRLLRALEERRPSAPPVASSPHTNKNRKRRTGWTKSIPCASDCYEGSRARRDTQTAAKV